MTPVIINFKDVCIGAIHKPQKIALNPPKPKMIPKISMLVNNSFSFFIYVYYNTNYQTVKLDEREQSVLEG